MCVLRSLRQIKAPVRDRAANVEWHGSFAEKDRIMDVMDAIHKRRSVRDFASDALTKRLSVRSSTLPSRRRAPSTSSRGASRWCRSRQCSIAFRAARRPICFRRPPVLCRPGCTTSCAIRISRYSITAGAGCDFCARRWPLDGRGLRACRREPDTRCLRGGSWDLLDRLCPRLVADARRKEGPQSSPGMSARGPNHRRSTKIRRPGRATQGAANRFVRLTG